jgi:hypothetical protein
MPDPAVVTGGTSSLPDNFAVNLLKFCCANIVVVRPAVATASNNNVAAAVLKVSRVLFFFTNVKLCNHLVVYNISLSNSRNIITFHGDTTNVQSFGWIYAGITRYCLTKLRIVVSVIVQYVFSLGL